MVCSILVAPIALLSYFVGIRPLLGHIAVLPEARGKMRKIGITDFWTQILFRPLHDSIYAQLANIPEDGTSNQTGPIIRMLGALNLVKSQLNESQTEPVIVNNNVPITKSQLEFIKKSVDSETFDSIMKTLAERFKPTSKDDVIYRKSQIIGAKTRTVQSLDLTAATDRLPVLLQSQILSLLGYPGNL